MAGESQRVSQRRATRGRLQDAAVARFRHDGFEKTSVAAIAADAGVTERTFFRHFASKEAVLFEDYERRLEWFRGALTARPPAEPLLDSVKAAIQSFPDDHTILHRLADLRRQVLSADAIETHIRLVQGSFARAIETRVADRLRTGDVEIDGDQELVAIVLGNTVAGALLAVLDLWTRTGGRDAAELQPLVDRAFELVAAPPLLRAGI